MRGSAVRGDQVGATRLGLCAVVALVVALGMPATAQAQDTAQAVPTAGEARTHTVKKGDTLWDLARAYIGDAFQWPEIYRINTDVVEDPHWIFPGEVLRLPGGQPVEQDSVVEEEELPPPASTVFGRPEISASGGGNVGEETLVRATVRMGDFERAPWVDHPDAPRGSGRVLGTTELDSQGQPLQRQSYQLFERVFITPPNGAAAVAGARFMAVARGTDVHRMGRIIAPTAMLEVVRAATRQLAAEARVIELYDALRADHHLVPYDSSPALVFDRPAAVERDQRRETEVRWIVDEPGLPTLQHYVLLRTQARDNVKLGDEYVLFEPARALNNGPDSQEIEVARVQVVKVTPRGSTAMVVGQRRPSIRPGVRARLAARMP